MKYATILLFIFLLSSPAFSQDQTTNRQRQANLIFGTAAFLDEDIPFDHVLIGGSVRFHLTRRLSVEPEFLYMKGPDFDRDYFLTGNIAYDLAAGERYTIYVIGGGGLEHNTNRFGTSRFSVNSWTASGGIGAQLFLTNRFFVAPEFRLGWEPLMRASVAIGYSF